MSRRIGGTEVVNRIDDAAGEELSPDSIHRGFREVWMRGHPARKLLAWIAIGRDRSGRVVEQRRFNGRLCSWMKKLDTSSDVLGTEIHVDGVVDDYRTHLEQAREESGHSPK